MIENEVVFRNRNEHLQQNFAELKQVAEEEGQESFLEGMDNVLEFYCECSDANCRKRLRVKANRYQQVHKRRDQFLVLPGHEVLQIERVVAAEPEFFIVEKLKVPSEVATSLHQTDVDNS